MKAFVPAKDFDLSKRFYQALGFEMCSDQAGIAYFRAGSCSFLLQAFYEPDHASNFMMHLLVEDVRAWHEHIERAKREGEFDFRITEVEEQPWGLLDFCLWDPSGVLWRIAQNLPRAI